MVKFLSLQYRLGHITETQLQTLIGGVITEGEYTTIVGGDTDVH